VSFPALKTYREKIDPLPKLAIALNAEKTEAQNQRCNRFAALYEESEVTPFAACSDLQKRDIAKLLHEQKA